MQKQRHEESALTNFVNLQHFTARIGSFTDDKQMGPLVRSRSSHSI